jgi:hypothetical protein
MMALQKIQTVCAAHFKISRQRMLSSARAERIVYPRMAAMMMCRELGFTFAEIGSAFGKEEGTAHHACQAVRERMEVDGNFRGQMVELGAKFAVTFREAAVRSPLLQEMDALLKTPNLFPETIALIRAAIKAQESPEIL